MGSRLPIRFIIVLVFVVIIVTVAGVVIKRQSQSTKSGRTPIELPNLISVQIADSARASLGMTDPSQVETPPVKTPEPVVTPDEPEPIQVELEPAEPNSAPDKVAPWVSEERRETPTETSESPSASIEPTAPYEIYLQSSEWTSMVPQPAGDTDSAKAQAIFDVHLQVVFGAGAANGLDIRYTMQTKITASEEFTAGALREISQTLGEKLHASVSETMSAMSVAPSRLVTSLEHSLQMSLDQRFTNYAGSRVEVTSFGAVTLDTRQSTTDDKQSKIILDDGSEQ